VTSVTGQTYNWPHPPILPSLLFPELLIATAASSNAADIKNAYALGIFGDSVTTDHISPAGSIRTLPQLADIYWIKTSPEPISIVMAHAVATMK